jgi:hypothetical protein
LQLVAFFGLGAFGLVSLVVASRLLLLASRTRQLPEFLIGLSLLTGGVLGRAPIAAGASIDSLPETLRVGLYMGGRFMMVICCAAIAMLAWRVFQRDQAWARGLFLLLIAVLAIHSAVHVFVTPPGMPLNADFAGWMGTVARTGAFAWASWEALRYCRMLRRRAPLGLADPVVANRIALWGVASGLIGFLFLLNPVAKAFAGVAPENLGLLLLQSLVGLVVAVCVALAFFPPRAYLEWIGDRAMHLERGVSARRHERVSGRG